VLKLKLHWQILIAIITAAIVGIVADKTTTVLGVLLLDVFQFMGTLFINALKMIIVPLIVSSIITGVSGLGQGSALGRLGGKTLLFYALSSLLAILIGLAFVNIIEPGIENGQPVKEQLALSADQDALMKKVEGKSQGDIVDVFLRMVPTNIVDAATDNGQMLGVIFFSLLFGIFMLRLDSQLADSQRGFWQGVFDTMMHMTLWVMKFAPIGVFGLVASVVMKTGFGAFVPILKFFITVLSALAFHMFILLPLVLKFVGRVSPVRHFKAMAPSLLTAFSSASSSATLPLTMECIEKNAKVSNQTSSFVLPLGATVNMDGTALYECVAAMFIAQAYGLELSIGVQFSIVLIALLTSIGVAGIPSASLVAISIILGAIGLPVEAIGVLMVTDRILDMCRTSVNVFSDSCATVVIAKSEGEDQVLATT